MRRKFAFYTGVDLQAEAEFDESNKLLGFKGVPDVLPIVPKQGMEVVDYAELVKRPETEARVLADGEEETKEPVTASRANYDSLIDYGKIETESK